MKTGERVMTQAGAEKRVWRKPEVILGTVREGTGQGLTPATGEIIGTPDQVDFRKFGS